MYTVVHATYRLFFSDFNETLGFSACFRKILKQNFMKIRPVRAGLFQAAGRTVIQTLQISNSLFANLRTPLRTGGQKKKIIHWKIFTSLIAVGNFTVSSSVFNLTVLIGTACTRYAVSTLIPFTYFIQKLSRLDLLVLSATNIIADHVTIYVLLHHLVLWLAHGSGFDTWWLMICGGQGRA